MAEVNDILALYGGKPVIDYRFMRYNSIGEEEVEAATSVLKSGVLSKFVASWTEDFYGGPKVQEFERACESFFQIRNAITVNSWTSGLIAAVGAIGTQPGDEIIVSPWTMSASATAILHWNAIPVFADIERDSFCIDPVSVEKNISPQTTAILAIDIFGQSANMQALTEIAIKYNLKIISDSAQAPSAISGGKFAGTQADIGGFSLNYHKHINTGEGGVLFTDDDVLAERLRLIRNHAEAVVQDKGETDLTNMLGHNFRMGEIEAAIGIEQLKKLDRAIKTRVSIADKLNAGLKNLQGLSTPRITEGNTHIYYKYGMIVDSSITGVTKFRLAEALRAEGVQGISTSYVNVHLFPMFQQKIAYGSKGFPWTSDVAKREVDYRKGICPVAEELQDHSYLGFDICEFNLSEKDVDKMVLAFQKVWRNLEYLTSA